MRKTVKGRYRTTHKKVVSNFSKERMGQIDFLNPSENSRLPSRRRYVFIFPCFSVGLGRGPYEILMNRSGLSDDHFAMLMLAMGRFVPLGPWLSSF
jgi:hypothetical protein